MIEPIIKNGTKVIFGPCRLSYVHLHKKYSPDGDPSQGKYTASILIPKGEKATIDAVRQAADTARKAGIASRWSGKEPRRLDMPLHDGDERENDGDGVYAGHLYLNAKCATRPGVVDRDMRPITDENEVYSGMWALVSVTFYAYDVSGNRGVACGLNNVLKWKDDARLGGRVSAETDFGGLDDEDDEDL